MWYSVDVRNLRYAELWRIAPGAGFLVAAVLKTLRVPLKMDAGVTMVEALTRPDRVAVDGEILEALDREEASFHRAGFRRLFYYTVPLRGAGQRACAAALLSSDGLTLGQTLFAEKRTPQRTVRRVQSNCLSRMGDGGFLGVSSGRRRMDPPPEFHGENLPGRSPEALYARHRERLSAYDRARPVALRESEVERFIVEIENRVVRFHANRGVYVPQEDSTGTAITPS